MQPCVQQHPMAYRTPHANGSSSTISGAQATSGQLRDRRRIIQSLSTRGVWRFAIPIYRVCATALIPWIICLAIIQPRTGYAYHVAWVGLGLVILFTVGALTTGVLCALRSTQAALSATFTATVAFVTAWFSVVALIQHTKALSLALMIFAPLTCLMAWLAVHVVRSRAAEWTVPRWVSTACFTLPALFVPWTVVYLLRVTPIVETHRLRLVWTGLDLFELAAMLVVVSCIRRGSPWLVVGATALGCLLCCDAWVNVMASSGIDQALGIGLAVIELPLAAYSLALAVRAGTPVGKTRTILCEPTRGWEARGARHAAGVS